MATSLNNMIDGWKLCPGYEFLVSVDTYSENVVLVTGFIGSRKYRGALLSLAPNSIKACVSDNVFNSDFSAKNCHSLAANMTITNYYSHSKLKQADVTMFSINNKRAKENYVCANCKMKISYFTKKESKMVQSADLSLKKSSNGTASNGTSCDITLLKQTLSYPEISEDNLPVHGMTVDHGKKKSLVTCPEKSLKPLKRKNQLTTNHAVQEKKVKINSSPPKETRSGNENCEKIVRIDDNPAPPPPPPPQSSPVSTENLELEMKTVVAERSDVRQEEKEKREAQKESIQVAVVVEVPVQSSHCEKTTINRDIKTEVIIDATEKEVEKQNAPHSYDEYRSMPLSLSTLNHLNDNDWTSDDSLNNRECPKPKKIWMKMIENEDFQKLIDPVPHPIPPGQTSADVIVKLEKRGPQGPHHHHHIVHNNSNKFSHANRSYKIKQTLHDKVILTVEKRPEKHRHDPLRSKPLENVFSDVYAFSEETESLMTTSTTVTNTTTSTTKTTSSIGTAGSKINNHKCLLMDQNSFLNSVFEMGKKDLSTKLINNSSTSSQTGSSAVAITSSTRISSRQSDLKAEEHENDSVQHTTNTTTTTTTATTIDQLATTIKIELDSNRNDQTDDDMQFCKENSLVTSSMINTCVNSAGIAFNLSDIVWAKITGYPFWPAKIISFTQEDDSFVGCIEWYAWNEISFIKVNSLYHFKTFFSSKYQKRNRSGKYQEAVKLAKLDCGMSEDHDTKNLGSIKGSDTDSCTSASL